MDAKFPYGLTVGLVIWGAVAPFLGIFLGNVLTRSSEREQWIKDKRNEEWRELLTALAESLRVHLRMYPGRPLGQDDQREILNVSEACFRAIRDRIFIAADVRKLNLENWWSAAVMRHQEDLDALKLGSTYDAIRVEIVKMATDVKNK